MVDKVGPLAGNINALNSIDSPATQNQTDLRDSITPANTGKKRKLSSQPSTRQKEVSSWKHGTYKAVEALWELNVIPKRNPTPEDILDICDLVKDAARLPLERRIFLLEQEKLECWKIKVHHAIVEKDFQLFCAKGLKSREDALDAKDLEREATHDAKQLELDQAIDKANAERVILNEEAMKCRTEFLDLTKRRLDSLKENVASGKLRRELIETRGRCSTLEEEVAELRKFKQRVTRKTKGCVLECPHCDGDITTLLR
jgi:hypothetical protein